MAAERLISKGALHDSQILLLGGGGYLGSVLRNKLSREKISFYSPSAQKLDITDQQAVAEAISQLGGETVLLLAAVTDVGGVEKDENLYELAQRVNIDGVRNVAEACMNNRKRLIYIATGYERAGTDAHPGPYRETDPLADEVGELELLGRYAQTKLLGDRAVRTVFGNDFSQGLAIIFVDYPCGITKDVGLAHQRPWYLQTLLTNQAKGYPAFADQFLTITPVDKVAEAVRIICREEMTGVFNIAAKGIATPYEILRYMMEQLEENPNLVKQGSILEYKKKVGRIIWPVKGGLDSSETEKRLAEVEPGFSFPSWQEVIDQSLEGPGGLREFWQEQVTSVNQAGAS